MTIFYLILTSFFVTLILMSISILISKKSNMLREKMTPFECGFNFFNVARLPFSMQFFLIAIIFIIFDVEIILIVPLIPTMFKANIFSWTKASMSFILIFFIRMFFLFIQWKFQ